MTRIETIVATDGESTEIAIAKPLRQRNYDIAIQDEIFAAEATQVEIALFQSLPGGLYDRLLGAMLARKSSHFIVRHR